MNYNKLIDKMKIKLLKRILHLATLTIFIKILSYYCVFNKIIEYKLFIINSIFNIFLHKYNGLLF